MIIKIFVVTLIVLILVSFVRVFIGPTVWDRLLVVSVISTKFIVFFVFLSLMLDLDYLVDVSFAYGILASVEIIFLTQFIKTKGRI